MAESEGSKAPRYWMYAAGAAVLVGVGVATLLVVRRRKQQSQARDSDDELLDSDDDDAAMERQVEALRRKASAQRPSVALDEDALFRVVCRSYYELDHGRIDMGTTLNVVRMDLDDDGAPGEYHAVLRCEGFPGNRVSVRWPNTSLVVLAADAERFDAWQAQCAAADRFERSLQPGAVYRVVYARKADGIGRLDDNATLSQGAWKNYVGWHSDDVINVLEYRNGALWVRRRGVEGRLSADQWTVMADDEQRKVAFEVALIDKRYPWLASARMEQQAKELLAMEGLYRCDVQTYQRRTVRWVEIKDGRLRDWTEDEPVTGTTTSSSSASKTTERQQRWHAVQPLGAQLLRLSYRDSDGRGSGASMLQYAYRHDSKELYVDGSTYGQVLHRKAAGQSAAAVATRSRGGRFGLQEPIEYVAAWDSVPLLLVVRDSTNKIIVYDGRAKEQRLELFARQSDAPEAVVVRVKTLWNALPPLGYRDAAPLHECWFVRDARSGAVEFHWRYAEDEQSDEHVVVPKDWDVLVPAGASKLLRISP